MYTVTCTCIHVHMYRCMSIQTHCSFNVRKLHAMPAALLLHMEKMKIRTLLIKVVNYSIPGIHIYLPYLIYTMHGKQIISILKNVCFFINRSILIYNNIINIIISCCYVLYVTVYGKTRHMGSACYSRNTRF